MSGKESTAEEGIVREDYELLKWENPRVKSSSEKEKQCEDDESSEEEGCEDESGEYVRGEDECGEDDSFTIEVTNVENMSEIINSIFPPRQWEEGGETWIQYVSPKQAPRSEIQDLSAKLVRILTSTRALLTGFCQIRRTIYTQLFDELVRMMAVADPLRGLLLLRVRDDMKMTIDTLVTLADSAVTLGMQKASEAEEGVPELLKSIEELEEKKEERANQLYVLKKMYGVRERGFKDWKNREVAKHQRKIEFLKATNEGIQNQWDLITAWKPQNIEMEKYLFQEDP